MASGSTLGSANATSLVTTACVHADEPAKGTSSTSMPAALYHPIFIAMANGAAADETVFAHQPTRTLVAAGTDCAMTTTSARTSEQMIARFMNRPPPSRV